MAWSKRTVASHRQLLAGPTTNTACQVCLARSHTFVAGQGLQPLYPFPVWGTLLMLVQIKLPPLVGVNCYPCFALGGGRMWVKNVRGFATLLGIMLIRCLEWK